jgi:ribosomal protein S18 acetylase RimI-like enzyme
MMRNGEAVIIQASSKDKLAEIIMIQTSFLNGKHCCCLLPLGSCKSNEDKRKKFEKTPELYNVGAVAVDTSTGEALGYMQLALHGMPCEMHDVKPGECYIDWIAVLPQARGKGVGTKLLEWGKETARARGCTYMSLGVINGNPAIRLYERFAFKKTNPGCVEVSTTCLFITCVFGRPYGCFHSSCGGMIHHGDSC